MLWLPPYSPDFNPVENAFSEVKYYLKEHDEIMQVVNNPLPVIQAAFDSITREDCIGGVGPMVINPRRVSAKVTVIVLCVCL